MNHGIQCFWCGQLTFLRVDRITGEDIVLVRCGLCGHNAGFGNVEVVPARGELPRPFVDNTPYNLEGVVHSRQMAGFDPRPAIKQKHAIRAFDEWQRERAALDEAVRKAEAHGDHRN